MSSRLDRITDWAKRARAARYAVGALARAVGVAPRQLDRHFWLHFRRAPKAWMEALRLRDAKKLLREGRPVKEVAHLLGFKHDTHFSRAFKQRSGRAPHEVLYGRSAASPRNTRRTKSEKGRQCPKMVVHSAGLVTKPRRKGEHRKPAPNQTGL